MSGWSSDEECAPIQSAVVQSSTWGDSTKSRGGGYRGRGGPNRNRDFGNQNRNRDFGNQNRHWDSGSQNSSQNRNRGIRNYQSDCEVIKVPSRFVGRIIGRGGSKIDELQLQTDVKIDVTKETEGDLTIVKLFGSKENIDKAKELIDDLTTERERGKPQAPREKPAVSLTNFAPNNVPDVSAKVEVDAPFNWMEFVKQSEKFIEEEWKKLPPLRKEFYEEHPEVTALTDDEVATIREENNNIVVDRTFKTENSKPVPKPIVRFEHAFHNYPEILEEIRKAGFETPSPIQCQAWPVLLKGEDLIGIAQTGTGKTLAFLLPALIHIDGQDIPREERGGPAVLIMAPTRELALQIDKEIKKYRYKGISSVCVYGGGDRKEQINVVTSGVDIVIATPGRMNDLAENGHLNVKTVSYVVLDEADRMLDMGFEPQIRKVMYSLRPNRQCVMTSATWPPGVRRLASSYMCDPVQVYVGSLDLAATHTVTQTVLMIDDKEKESMFFDFARNVGPDEKIIVFCGTKARADYLSVELSLAGIMCTALHGNRDQSDREQAVADISSGAVKILIATDVASRGLDIDDVTHVINYDFPKNIEEYVHRVGRTGRAGKSGESISYFTRNDWAVAGELIKILEEAQQYVPEELHSMKERFEAMKEKREREGGLGGGGGRGRGGGFRRSGGNRW